MDEIYNHPLYYDIAFGYRDFAAEVRELERCFATFAAQPIHTILELGCGSAPHMLRLLDNGYDYCGLDLNQGMLDFAATRAARAGWQPQLFLGDLTEFSLREPVDAILVMLGSLYVQSTAELLSHLQSVARALHPGGIYFLDWCIDFEPLGNKDQYWQERRGNIHVNVHYRTAVREPAEQLFDECITLDVFDGKQHHVVDNHSLRRAIYPQEFLLALRLTPELEFVGWYQDWNIQRPLAGCKQVERPITVVRRRVDSVM